MGILTSGTYHKPVDGVRVRWRVIELTILHENSRQTTKELEDQVDCDNKNVLIHLNSLGKVHKILNENNKNLRSTIAFGLLT